MRGFLVAVVFLLGLAPAFGESRKVYTNDNMPTFTVSSATVRNSATIFLSPSCQFCRDTFVEVMAAVKAGEPALANTEITFVVIPRITRDVDAIATLLCVDSRQRLVALDRYFKSLPSGGTTQTDSQMAKIAQGFGVSGARLQSCLADQRKQQAIAATLEIANSAGKLRSMPTLVYNNAWSAISDGKDVIRIAKRKAR